MSERYVQTLSSSLQRKDWARVESHLLPSKLPNALLSNISISKDLEVTTSGHFRFQIEGLPWPNKFFSEGLIHLLALKKGLSQKLRFPDKLTLFSKLFNSLGRQDVLGRRV